MIVRLVLFAGILLPLAAVGRTLAENPATEVVRASGVHGGLLVHVGCSDGSQIASLRQNESFLVRGLDTDADRVDVARRRIQSLGCYGPVSVDTFDGRHLPFVDNLVNLLVADELTSLELSEVMRVLAPRGVAMIGDRKIVKPWPDTIDQWSHFLHGPDNNSIANDGQAGPPQHMQWQAGPLWTRHHHADKGTAPTIRAVVSTHGRLFYMVDEAGTSDMSLPGKWYLAARDGFSGLLLWKRALQAEAFERQLEQVWRTLIADGDRVYAPLGVDLPLSELNAATGETTRDYPGTEGLQEVIKSESTLLVIAGTGHLLAMDAATGQQLWQWFSGKDDAIVRSTLAASDGRVFIKTETSVHCLSAADGTTIWQRQLQPSRKRIRLRYPHEKLLVADGVVLCSYGGNDPKSLDSDAFEYLGSHPRVREYDGKLAALSAEDGSPMWHADYMPGLESMPGEIYVNDGTVWLGPDFAQPRDLRTGTVQGSDDVIDRLWTTGHHYRCYPGKATCNFILTAKRGIELIDLDGNDHSRNNWVRATCRVGVLPCNGLIYAPPHSCGCYMEAKLFGFWALAAERQGTAERESQIGIDRLQRGPAYEQKLPPLSTSQAPSASDWPTYRGDAERSGGAHCAVAGSLDQKWTTEIRGRLSQPVIGNGSLYVSQVDEHTVHCLNASTGESLWSYTVGGRVDSPPTLYQDLVLFGSHDGCVYCLRADSGELVWRFRAATESLSAVAFEQLESLWPVHGSVLVRDGLVYAAAGRSSYLDGGIVMVGLDAHTGEVRCSTRISSERTGALDSPPAEDLASMDAKISQNNTDYKTFLAADRSDAFSMDGALTDVLVTAGDSIFMRHLRFDRELVEQEQKLPHLFSTSSLLDDTEHHRSFWVLGTADFSRTPVAFPWIVRKSLAAPYGLLLTFDEQTVWGVHRPDDKGRQQDYVVFAARRPDPENAEARLPDFASRSKSKPDTNLLWAAPFPKRPRALLRAQDKLFIGGQESLSPDAIGFVQSISSDSGKPLDQWRLSAAPVWDGMAAADGRLYISQENGEVVCLE